MVDDIYIHWFRQDLRISDNPSLASAAKAGKVLPIYILDDENSGSHKMGGASRWWLHYSLISLKDSLEGNLHVFKGDPLDILQTLISKHAVKGIFWNRCYEPWRIKRDKKIKETLSEDGIEVKSYKASLLWEPWEVSKNDGTPYRVFTPYYRKGCLGSKQPREPIPKPDIINYAKGDFGGVNIEGLNLLPQVRWDKQLEPHWEIGEKGAHKALKEFLEGGISNYKEGRNFPAQKNVSRLSPYLHWGEISPHQVWYDAISRGDDHNIDCFMSELGWREFSHSLLYYQPTMPQSNLQKKFDNFPWQDKPDHLKAWQEGMTGYPIVDAGMRELWQTGYMHNRVRMIVGSFLVKNLLLDWRFGASWFWDCLVDADLANNSASWQWVAGCGADAAPYFRIFNPVTQGEKFDSAGEYTRHYVPELKDMPDNYLFKPWSASDEILKNAGVKLGQNYPHPIVELKGSRERALEAFKSLK